MPQKRRKSGQWAVRAASVGIGVVVTVLAATTVSASPLGNADRAVAAGTDRLGCVFTVKPPHIDHSGTRHDGMMKSHAEYRCGRAMSDLIIRTCLGYWDGAKWVGIVCKAREIGNTGFIEVSAYHRGGCDLGHHRYRNAGHIAVFNASGGSVVLGYYQFVKHRRC